MSDYILVKTETEMHIYTKTKKFVRSYPYNRILCLIGRRHMISSMENTNLDVIDIKTGGVVKKFGGQKMLSLQALDNYLLISVKDPTVYTVYKFDENNCKLIPRQNISIGAGATLHPALHNCVVIEVATKFVLVDVEECKTVDEMPVSILPHPEDLPFLQMVAKLGLEEVNPGEKRNCYQKGRKLIKDDDFTRTSWHSNVVFNKTILVNIDTDVVLADFGSEPAQYSFEQNHFRSMEPIPGLSPLMKGKSGEYIYLTI